MSRLRSSKLWHVLRRMSVHQLQSAIHVHSLPIEILELIFARLDLLTLLHCQTVCRLWHSCIPGTSPALRTILFLPTTPQTSHHHLVGHFPPEAQPPYLQISVNFAANDFQDTRDPQPATEYTVRALSKSKDNAYKTDLHEYNRLLFEPMSESRLKKHQRTWSTSTPTTTTLLPPPTQQPRIVAVANHHRRRSGWACMRLYHQHAWYE